MMICSVCLIAKMKFVIKCFIMLLNQMEECAICSCVPHFQMYPKHHTAKATQTRLPG